MNCKFVAGNKKTETMFFLFPKEQQLLRLIPAVTGARGGAVG